MPSIWGQVKRAFVPSRSRADERTPSLWGLLRPYVRQERVRLVIVAVLAIAGGLAEALLLVALAQLAVKIAAGKSHIVMQLGPLGSARLTVTQLVLIAGGLAVARSVLRAVGAYFGTQLSTNVITTTRRRLIVLYLAATWELQARQREGRLQEVLTTYAGATATALGNSVVLVTSGLNLSVLLIVALIANPLASLGAGVAAIGIGLLLQPLRAAVRRRSARAAAAGLEFATGLTELASTLQEVRVFGVMDRVGERLDRLVDRAAETRLKTGYAGSSIGIIYQGAAMLLIVTALGFANALGLSGTTSVGAVVLIMLRSLSYAQGTQSSVQGIYESAPYLDQLRNEEDEYRAAAQPPGARPSGGIGTIKFQDVCFEYEPGVPVLRNISFSVPPGEIVGIVGPSGAGKSTLVQLLLRLREPTAGVMLVDGEDARDILVHDWYERVSFVPQEARLFAASAADCIRFFRDVDDAGVERAAKLAHIHDDIVSWPRGYDTWVGERGGQVSGGQRQRLCIARALVGNPDMIIFDEPTSALDVRSESLMRETMQDLGGSKTVFIVAHRLSTLSICDRIMVILGGELQGFDASDRLEAENPFYREALKLSGMR